MFIQTYPSLYLKARLLLTTIFFYIIEKAQVGAISASGAVNAPDMRFQLGEPDQGLPNFIKHVG